MLKLLADEHRLLILCRLSIEGEMPVSQSAEAVGFGQSVPRPCG
jgi:hypothetical protein